MKLVAPKHKEIKEKLLALMKNADAHDKLPSIRTMMKHFNVSQLIIERCLEELEEEGIILRKHGAGIFINHAKKKHAKLRECVGVVLEKTDDHYNSLVLAGITERASKEGINIAVYSNNRDYETELNDLRVIDKQNLSGVIIIPTTKNIGNTTYTNSLKKLYDSVAIPFVFVDYLIPGIPADMVTSDNFGAAKTGTSLLIRDGVKEILIIADPQSNVNLERIRGIDVALGKSEKEIGVEYCYIHQIHTNNRRIYEKILKKPPETIFMLLPSQIQQLLIECWRAGLKPNEDLRIMYFVEPDFKRNINEDIFALIKPSRDIGRRAFEILRDRITGDLSDKPVIERLEVKLKK